VFDLIHESSLPQAFTFSQDNFSKYLNSRLKYTEIPKQEKILHGDIWAITSFFNPAAYSNKYQNYKKFRASSKKQGLKLITVELSFNGNFEIKNEDAEILIQIQGEDENILWQKEALMNIALKNLPDSCDKVIWVDSDIIFHNDSWIQETAELLNQYVVVQAFSFVIRLPQYCDNPLNLDLDPSFDVRHSTAKAVSCLGPESLLTFDYSLIGEIGFAWAIRREVIEKIGFIDKSILGGADTLMAYAFYGLNWNSPLETFPSSFIKYTELWREKIFNEVKGSVFYTPGLISHLWHGDIKKRFYRERHSCFSKYDFDPELDLVLEPGGLLQWNTTKTDLKQYVKKYFELRTEEG
jgi:hypothetical protein